MSQVATSAEPLDWRALLPREHGLWGWLGVPLFMAAVLAPVPSTFLAAATVFCGFAATNALGRGWRGSARAFRVVPYPLAAAALFGGCAVVVAANPVPLVVALATAAIGGPLAIWALGGQLGRRRPAPTSLRAALVVDQNLELLGIFALVGLAAAIAASGGASPDGILAASALVAGWLALGLWWVNRQMSAVLPKRVPWPGGIVLASAVAVLGAVVAVAAGHPVAAALLALYPVRMGVHSRPSSARDAKRVGFTELFWGLAVAGLAAIR